MVALVACSSFWILLLLAAAWRRAFPSWAERRLVRVVTRWLRRSTRVFSSAIAVPWVLAFPSSVEMRCGIARSWLTTPLTRCCSVATFCLIDARAMLVVEEKLCSWLLHCSTFAVSVLIFCAEVFSTTASLFRNFTLSCLTAWTREHSVGSDDAKHGSSAERVFRYELF